MFGAFYRRQTRLSLFSSLYLLDFNFRLIVTCLKWIANDPVKTCIYSIGVWGLLTLTVLPGCLNIYFCLEMAYCM